MTCPKRIVINIAQSPLGEGETAKVYAWHEGTVLKIFRPGVLRSEIEAEARATKVAHSLGAGAPDVGEVVDIDGSLGLVFERVSGQSMLNRLIQKPEEAERLAMVLADLHAHIHSCTAPPEMPSQAHLLQLKVGRTDIPAELGTRISGALAASISERSLCHGDFHPANIMLDGDKAFVIDWNDAARGNPALDVARTTAVVLGAALERPQLLRDRAFPDRRQQCRVPSSSCRWQLAAQYCFNRFSRRHPFADRRFAHLASFRVATAPARDLQALQ